MKEIEKNRENCMIEEAVYSSTYNIIAVIDYYDTDKKILIEKKRFIKHVYKSYIFQLYAQYYALRDEGLEVKKIFLYSITDKKYYSIALPKTGAKLTEEFELLLKEMKQFCADDFVQTNKRKCENCIYNNLCDRSLND